jgi:putative ABC transport system permease protein
VESASQMAVRPLGGSVWNERIVVGGATQQTFVHFNSVGRNYFRTMGTPFVAGRDFSRGDTRTAPKVAIVNELFARAFFGGQSPIGQIFRVESGPGEPHRSYEVVGVVKDSKYRDLRSAIPPQAFLAASQDSEPDPSLQLVIRTGLPAATVTTEVTTALREIHPAILLQFSTLEQTMRSSLASERLMATLSGFFGGLAMLIATIGLYGVMSYTVARRQTEIGIRMALGADRAAVVRMILREAAKVLAIGLPLGAVLSVAGAQFAAALLYGLKPWDPAALVIATGGLALVATLASWIPAQRAARLEPTTALRQE